MKKLLIIAFSLAASTLFAQDMSYSMPGKNILPGNAKSGKNSI